MATSEGSLADGFCEIPEAVEEGEGGSLETPELEEAFSPPQLSQDALDELGQLEKNQDLDDPENYPLYSPWAFWFER